MRFVELKNQTKQKNLSEEEQQSPLDVRKRNVSEEELRVLAAEATRHEIELFRKVSAIISYDTKETIWSFLVEKVNAVTLGLNMWSLALLLRRLSCMSSTRAKRRRIRKCTNCTSHHAANDRSLKLYHGRCDCGQCVCDHGWFGEACQHQKVCNLSKKKSNELCRSPQGVICSNAGTCQCGSCVCGNTQENGMIYGQFCECDDTECVDDETGEICGGHGKCYCGNCYCMAGWHGDKCEFQCDISPWESKKRCTSPDGKICSNRGTCICGECTCYDVDPTGEWGDIHGDTCECDERNCHSTYDRYADDFCSGKCQCGQCTCFPPGDERVHGKNCECDDRQCEDVNGETCSVNPTGQSPEFKQTSEGLAFSFRGHGICSCGRCVCQDGWFGKLCQFVRSCNMTEEESRSLCETSDGVMCTGKGNHLFSTVFSKTTPS
ncbi:ITGBL protein, partial [Polyodon spathula]|nr:ITGBL protein [Polyodon spathula]